MDGSATRRDQIENPFLVAGGGKDAEDPLGSVADLVQDGREQRDFAMDDSSMWEFLQNTRCRIPIFTKIDNCPCNLKSMQHTPDVDKVFWTLPESI